MNIGTTLLENNLEDNHFLVARVHSEPKEAEPKRGEFQHDRDRIIHSRAFRRLMHKTQVFNANKGDHYRNRLTLSLIHI